MSEKSGKTERMITAGSEATERVVSRVKTVLQLAALAIIGIVVLTLGALQLGKGESLGYFLIVIGGLVMIPLILWIARGGSASADPSTSAVALDDADWMKGQETHGFFVERGQTEIRFLDWDETQHREVYEKYLKIIPVRDGALRIDVLSGSSAAVKQTEAPSKNRLEIHHTHKHKRSRDDQFHIRTSVSIQDAKKGRPIELVDKSYRNGISNDAENTHSEVAAHPRLETLGVVEPNKWYAVIHVLYPTRKLSFRAELVGDHKALVETIKVHEFTTATVQRVDEPVRVIGTEEGTLQFLLWEKDNVKAGSDFVISWRWRNN